MRLALDLNHTLCYAVAVLATILHYEESRTALRSERDVRSRLTHVLLENFSVLECAHGEGHRVERVFLDPLSILLERRYHIHRSYFPVNIVRLEVERPLMLTVGELVVSIRRVTTQRNPD